MMETILELTKLINTEACVAVSPPVIQKIKGMARVGWGYL
jgi:hypothetical protein